LKQPVDLSEQPRKLFAAWNECRSWAALASIGNPEFTGVRMWRVKGFRRYLIFYRPIEDGIEIVRVIHSSRDIAALFGEDE